MNTFKVKVIRAIYNLIPMHMKRVVLWCSVMSAYRKSTEVNTACVKALNDLLHLARWDSTLGFPIQISKVVWEDFNGAVQILHDADNAEIEPSQREQMRNRFFKAIPSWLQYTNESKIMSDFDKILTNKDAVLA